jgi:dUTP pyrophosphatase
MLKVQKLHEDAIIPTKKEEDAGFDIYPAFDEEELAIQPLETVMIPTGIATAFDIGKVALLRERGSTGTLAMSLKAGVVDSGYRGEWFIAINNTSRKIIVISKEVSSPFESGEYQFYPYRKAIAQFSLIDAYHAEAEEVEDITQFDSERGEDMLGASGK